MADYEAEREKIQPRSLRSESASSAAFRRTVARWLDNAGLHRKAYRVRNCSPRKHGGLPCKERILCDYCRNVDTLKTKRDYAARVRSVMEDTPDTILLSATLTMGEVEDCESRARQLQTLLGTLLRLPGQVWSDVMGLFWFRHSVLAMTPGLWRPHYHCVLVVRAADFIGFKNHHRRLATGWGRAAWAVLHPNEPIPTTQESEDAFRRFMLHQRIVPLSSFGQSDLLSLRHSRHDRKKLVEDIYGLIEYAKRRKDYDDSEPNSSQMWPRHYCQVAQMPMNHKGLKGELYNVPAEIARAGAEALAEDHPPMRAEQSSEVCLPRSPVRKSKDENSDMADDDEAAAKVRRQPHRNAGSLNTMFRETIRSLRGYGMTPSRSPALRPRDTECCRKHPLAATYSQP